MRRSGRRPGNQDTRQSILDAARAVFAERGFDNASIRAIATAAKVDPALVHHYFGGKDQLFVAAVELPFNPADRCQINGMPRGSPQFDGPSRVRFAILLFQNPQLSKRTRDISYACEMTRRRIWITSRHQQAVTPRRGSNG